MPVEGCWSTFFDADCVLRVYDCVQRCGDVVEFGCGTFTVPAARRVSGTVYALDIDPEMIRLTADRAAESGLENVRAEQWDFAADGCGRPDRSVDHAMPFNIRHIEQPVALLREAYRALKPGGTCGVIRWDFDPSTPRGPSMEIRPRPEQCRRWAEEAGFEFVRSETLDCCAHRYGHVVRRPA